MDDDLDHAGLAGLIEHAGDGGTGGAEEGDKCTQPT